MVFKKAEKGPPNQYRENVLLEFIKRNLYFISWGRRPVFHILNLTYILTRLGFLFFYNNYWASAVIIALGSGFYPVGVRIADVLSKRLIIYMLA